MADNKAQPQAKTAPVKVVNVYGPMLHPFLNKTIDGETVFEGLGKPDSWLQSQIDAKKLKLV